MMHDHIDNLKQIAGESNAFDHQDDIHPFLEDWRGQVKGTTPLILFPLDTKHVQRIVQYCNENDIKIVSQGGNTSLCGANVPHSSEQNIEIVVNTSKMNKVIEVDPFNRSMIVESGCILQNIQNTAQDHDLLFPLSLSAEGSCQIGGNISTNAGGVNVLKYGMARDQVMGIEVVLPDGSIFSDLKSLRKDNTGYDLKHLFLGSEGTLGIITAAVLKLFPKPRGIYAAYCAVSSVSAAIELLNRARTESGDCVETFELISRLVMDLVLKHIPNSQDPLNQRYQHYVLLELVSTAEDNRELYSRFETILGKAMEDGLILDAALAQSEVQRQAFWSLRENATESQKIEGASIKHDISVPISVIPEFYETAWNAVLEVEPEARLIAFGHAGDGNLHFNVAEPELGKTEDFIDNWGEINEAVHRTVHKYGGSISAEHGIGMVKKQSLKKHKSKNQIEFMKKIKRCVPGLY